MAGLAIQVTPSLLKEKAERLKSQNNTLKSQIDTLENQARSLSGMWEGDAKAAFDKDVEMDIQKMRNFYDAIETYAQALENIAVSYENAERKNAQIASSR